MNQLLENIRNAVRAIIIHENQLLVLHKRTSNGQNYYALPGGAQDTGETLSDAVQRECKEEIDADVTVGPLIHVADYFKQSKTQPTIRHQMEFLFSCQLKGDYIPHNGPEPDKHQITVKWMPLDQLEQCELTPLDLRAILSQAPLSTAPIYLGSIK
jgi:8-oxo-dGTP diphosphatase